MFPECDGTSEGEGCSPGADRSSRMLTDNSGLFLLCDSSLTLFLKIHLCFSSIRTSDPVLWFDLQ